MRNKPYVIAEFGVNYYDTAKVEGITPIEAAMLYIDRAAKAGVDCAKFQSYKADTIASIHSPSYWDTTKETATSQYELFKRYDSFGEEEYGILADYAHEAGMDFTSTPFDYESADYLERMVDFYKISSSDITNLPFIKHIAAKGKPVCLSVGASYLSEIDEAVRVITDAGCEDLTLLHCMLSYPTKPEDANLEQISCLKRHFPSLKTGYSDHVAPDEGMVTLLTAYMLGAEVIEKHFTLDKKLAGNDHYHAGDPADFIKARKGFEWIDIIRGSGEKTVFPCEAESRRQARRSLVAARDIKAGELLQASDVVAKRPGTGISPARADSVIGRQARMDIAADEIITYEMI